MMRVLALAALVLAGGCMARVPVACFRDGSLPGCPSVLSPAAKTVPVPKSP